MDNGWDDGLTVWCMCVRACVRVDGQTDRRTDGRTGGLPYLMHIHYVAGYNSSWA